MQLRKKRTAEEGEMSENPIEIALPQFFILFIYFFLDKIKLNPYIFGIKSHPALLCFFLFSKPFYSEMLHNIITKLTTLVLG